jgi:UDP-glucuronate 4-epimerase
MNEMKILVTGAAGFIGSQLSKRLMDDGHVVKGIDNFNSHLYEPQLKRDRMVHFGLDIWGCDLKDPIKTEALLRDFEPEVIIHLAALAGVRDSLGKEKQYHANNIDATQNMIDICKAHIPDVRIIYASTSCVYAGSQTPWTEGEETGKQLNAYGYTKWANECQFQSSGLNTVGLRFFTVYGPWGRPDMALFDFTKNILAGNEITVYNYGDMKRDFTYVDDIIDGIECVLRHDDIESGEIFNIGRGEQVNLMDFIAEIEKNTGKEAIKNLAPKHPADTKETWSNTAKLEQYGYSPKVSIGEGVRRFYEWYKTYNEVD